MLIDKLIQIGFKEVDHDLNGEWIKYEYHPTYLKHNHHFTLYISSSNREKIVLETANYALDMMQKSGKFSNSVFEYLYDQPVEYIDSIVNDVFKIELRNSKIDGICS